MRFELVLTCLQDGAQVCLLITSLKNPVPSKIAVLRAANTPLIYRFKHLYRRDRRDRRVQGFLGLYELYEISEMLGGFLFCK